MDDLGQMIEEGFADEINDTNSEIEGGLENALNSWRLVRPTAAVMESNNES